MNARGKSIAFTPEEIVDLAEAPFRRSFGLLATLFPNVDTRHLFHIDHVYPRAIFSKRQLLAAGVEESLVDGYKAMMNKLPNLQLLEGITNIEKQYKLPLTWATNHCGEGLADYLTRQELEGLSDDVTSFPEFYAARRQRLARRLALALGVDPDAVEAVEDA